MKSEEEIEATAKALYALLRVEDEMIMLKKITVRLAKAEMRLSESAGTS